MVEFNNKMFVDFQDDATTSLTLETLLFEKTIQIGHFISSQVNK